MEKEYQKIGNVLKFDEKFRTIVGLNEPYETLKNIIWQGTEKIDGEEVKGSKIEKREDGTTWLLDDEPILECPFYGDGRDEWVEVDETTVVRL